MDGIVWADSRYMHRAQEFILRDVVVERRGGHWELGWAGSGGRLQEDLWDQRSAHRLVALRLGQMSVPTAMDEDKDVIIVNLIRPEQSGVSGAEIPLRLARGLGTGRPFFPLASPTFRPSFLASFHLRLSDVGQRIHPRGIRVECMCHGLHDSHPLLFRGADCTGPASSIHLRRGYYHIGCMRESYWLGKRSSCHALN
jgi:hypothetical protein